MCVYYNNQEKKVRGNKFWCCIPGSVFDKKETEFVNLAINRVDDGISEVLNYKTVKFLNFILFDLPNKLGRRNFHLAITKAKDIIPGTIVRILNQGLCIFFFYTIPLTALALCLYFGLFGLNMEFWLKIIIMVGIFIADIFLVCITTIKYANSVKDKQDEEVRREATQRL